jgi:hypothetical protein
MEQSVVSALLEKYWLAETSVEEEERLAAYFRQAVIAPELEPFRHVFAYFASEASVEPGDDLGDKILERIAELDPEQGVPVAVGIGRWWWAAAAIVLSVGLYLAVASSRGVRALPGGGDGVAVLNGRGASVNGSGDSSGSGGGVAVKDTYDDPKLAMAALQKALLAVSTKMNRGKKITQQQVGRMNDSWQTVMRNNINY